MGGVVVWAGVGLALAGLALVVFQMIRPPHRAPSRRVEAGVGPLNFALKTTYPGLVLVAFAVLLIVVGTVLG